MSVLGAQSRLESLLEDQIKYRRLRPQLLIAAVAGVLYSLDYLVLRDIIQPTAAIDIYEGVLFMLLAANLLLPFTFWFVMTSVVFFLARFLGAQAQFGTLIRATGLASFPLLGSTLAIPVGRYFALRNRDPCESALSCNPGIPELMPRQVDAISSFMGSATSTSAFQLSFAVAALFFLVAVYLWIILVEEVTTLTRAGATLLVGGPMLLVLLAVTYVTFV